jgi:uncharacterized protein
MVLTEALAIGAFVLEAVIKVWPIFLLTLVISTVIGALKMDTAINAALNRREGMGVALGGAVGAFSPFCSCTVIPVVRGLLVSGVPLAPVMAFWLASPTMDPEIFALSVGTLGWPLAILRLAAALIFSLGGGYITLALVRGRVITGSPLKDEIAVSATKPTCTCESESAPSRMAIRLPVFAMSLIGSGGQAAATAPVIYLPTWLSDALSGLRDLSWREIGKRVLIDHWKLGRWLIVAFVLEAMMIRYVPAGEIAAVLGQNNPFSVVLAALIGVPLYLENVAALPIVSGLLKQGMSQGAAIAFLLTGPVTTIPAMAAVWGVAKKRVFMLYLGVTFIGAIALGYLVDLIA